MKKEKKLFDAITDIENDLVEDARNARFKKRFPGVKKIALAACLVLAVGAVFLCLPLGQDRVIDGSSVVIEALFPRAYAFDDRDTWRQIREENPVEASFLGAVSDFSYNTASRLLTGETENANYSPISLYYALSLAATGADGQTADELYGLLGVSDGDALSVQCGNMFRRMFRDNNIGKLRIANSLWMDDAIPWKDGYVDNAAENFYADIYSVDFADSKTAKAMGAWISENTNGTLSPDLDFDKEHIMSIINTVYFYDQWTDKFAESKTEEDDFYLSGGEAVKADFMNATYGSHGFWYGDQYTASYLSLKDSGSMVFILPDEGTDIDGILSSPELLEQAVSPDSSEHGKVIWQIPKFSFGARLEMAGMLKTLGVSAAFSVDGDFSGITDFKPAYISGVSQETHIAIDEKGVEASAYTQIDYAGAAPPEGVAEMILNRPFIFAIKGTLGEILFIGVCNNPADH